MTTLEQTTRVPDALICLDLVCRVHRLPVDARALSQKFNVGLGPVEPDKFMAMAQHVGFKCKQKRGLTVDSIVQSYPMPVIAVTSTPEFRYLSLLGADQEGNLRVFNPWDPEAKIRKKEDFSNHWIVLYPEDQALEQGKLGLSWILQEVLVQRNALLQFLTLSLLCNCLGLVIPLATQQIFDRIIPTRAMNTLEAVGTVLVALALMELCFNLTRMYSFTVASVKVDSEILGRLFRILLSRVYRYFEKTQVGETTARFRDLEMARNFVSQRLPTACIDLLFSFVFAAALFFYSVNLALLTVAIVLVLCFSNFLITPLYKKFLEEKLDAGAKMNSFLVETLTGMYTVKATAIEGAIWDDWAVKVGHYVKSGYKLSNLQYFASGFASFAQRALTASIYVLGVFEVIENRMTPGALIAFSMLSGLFAGPAVRLASFYHEFQEAWLALRRLHTILGEPSEELPNRGALPELRGSISFNKVSFRYSESGNNVLKEVSFEIPAGAYVAFIGRTGSGKSTVTKLIQKLYQPVPGGQVLIDGVDLRELDPQWLRSQLGVVPQDSFLFTGTIKDNIAKSRKDASMTEIIHAAQMAYAHEFISKLPSGYDTMVGERGSTLSGGQRQRICIARALLSNPRIIIFDEATSALDNESDRIIRKTIDDIRNKRTVILVSHRLSAVVNCDIIFVMDDGKLVEQGSHKELMSAGGLYAHLYRSAEAE